MKGQEDKEDIGDKTKETKRRRRKGDKTNQRRRNETEKTKRRRRNEEGIYMVTISGQKEIGPNNDKN